MRLSSICISLRSFRPSAPEGSSTMSTPRFNTSARPDATRHEEGQELAFADFQIYGVDRGQRAETLGHGTKLYVVRPAAVGGTHAQRHPPHQRVLEEL